MTESPVWNSLLKRLQDKELILPLLENQVRADTWPESYTVTVDSRPYYGLNPDGTPDGFYHPSTHPLLPARRLYYEFHSATADQVVRERRNLTSQITLSMGSALHAIFQTQMQMTGLLTPENTEKQYTDPIHHVRGRIDMIVDHPAEGPVVTEIKTRYRFGATKEPLPAWHAQVSIALDNMGADWGVLLMIESGFPYRCKEMRIRRNDKLLDEIYAKFDLVRECIKRDAPPRDCCGYRSKEYEACPARYLCFGRDDD